jgi:simple sugar transport system ATP-binding protein
MRGISKQFGRVQALDNVGLTVESGSIHGVVGENGAGKSTLMKVLYGAYQADSGEVRVNGKAVNIRSSKEAIALGIGMVSQHYGIVPELSLLDNLILGAEPSIVLDKGKIRERASKIAQRFFRARARSFKFERFCRA